MKALTHCPIQDFVRKLPQENLSYSLRAAYHSQRVYFQIQQWKGVLLKPEDWGWKLSSGKLLPIRTQLPPADESLLEFVRCNCKKGCSTQKCTCRKNGLDSSPACGECKGYSCVNSAPPDLECDVEWYFFVNFKDFTFSICWRNLSLKIVLTLLNTVNSNFRYDDSRTIYGMYVLAQFCYLFHISVIFNQGYNSLLLLRSILFIALICTTYRHTSDIHLYCWVSCGRHDRKTNSGFVIVFQGIYHNTITKKKRYFDNF